jgi:hypothetical protein
MAGRESEITWDEHMTEVQAVATSSDADTETKQEFITRLFNGTECELLRQGVFEACDFQVSEYFRSLVATIAQQRFEDELVIDIAFDENVPEGLAGHIRRFVRRFFETCTHLQWDFCAFRPGEIRSGHTCSKTVDVLGTIQSLESI